MGRLNTGTGKGGKSFQDRELAAKVRTKGLNDVFAVLNEEPQVAKWSEYKKQMVMRLAPGLLPRLNEHSGPDGGDIPIPLLGGISNGNKGNNSHEQTTDSSEED